MCIIPFATPYLWQVQNGAINTQLRPPVAQLVPPQKRRKAIEQQFVAVPLTIGEVGRAKPSESLQKLREFVATEGREAWNTKARVAAVMGSCPKSHKSFISGLSHWLEYVEIARGPTAEAFPVNMSDVLGWSMTFRCLGTFGNYLSHLRGAACAIGFDPPPVGHPAIRRAMRAVANRCMSSPRPRMAIQRAMLRNMVAREQDPALKALRLVSYTWLLRLPSEALPMTMCESEPGDDVANAMWSDGEAICVRLASRKNMQRGSGVIKRFCTCPGGALTCPVHMAWEKYLARLPDRSQPWRHLSAAQALKKLREVLTTLDVDSPSHYGTHSFRRGHATDMLESGATLAVILSAGQWRSAAFMKYLKEADIERDVALEVACDTDEEIWID